MFLGDPGVCYRATSRADGCQVLAVESATYPRLVMAIRRRPKNRPATPPRSESIDPGESRASVLVTVAWTLAVMTCLMCQLAAVAARLLFLWDREAKSLYLFSQWMLWCGALVGVLALLLAPVVYRTRRVLPPTGLTVFAVCVAIAPILAIAIERLR